MLKKSQSFKYPGIRQATDGNGAVIYCEREASDAAGAYPITPSTQMGEYWAEEVGNGHLNISDKPLIFVEPESEHAAAAVTAGMSMTGLRATNFSSAQGVAFMHESLYGAVGKRLPYLLNIGCRAITKASLNVHCGHDDYHCIDDTGFFQVMAKDAQGAADLNLISRQVAELSLTPAVVAQDGFLTTHLIESVNVPERELIKEFLGRPDDIIDTPTAAQKMIYGEKRRRVPEIWDVDNPMVSGSVQNQDAYMQAVAAQRPYFFEHIASLTDQAMDDYYALTGRRYNRIGCYKTDDADYVIVGQGSMIVQAEAVADYLFKTRKLKVGVVNLTMFRPFPGDLIGAALKGKKGVVVLERTDQPLAEDLPLMREVRAAVTKCLENNVDKGEELPFPGYAVYAKPGDSPRLFSGCYGLGSRDLQPEGMIGAIENMLPDGKKRRFFYLSVDFVRDQCANPKEELRQQALLEAYPRIKDMAVRGSENPDLMPEGSITVRMHSVGGWGAITTGKNLAMTLYDLLGYEIKANPKYGSEKKGQPTTYYLSAAPEPIRVNCEYHYVDVVMSPDPNVFSHSNPLYGLKKGGSFIIQSIFETPAEVWSSFSLTAQRYIVDNEIRVFFIDGFKIAREEASNPELQFRMQGNVFQGTFFAASALMARNGLDEKGLFKAIEEQLESKFGSKGRRVVEDNLRVVRRGFDESQEILDKTIGNQLSAVKRKDAGLPIMLKQIPEGDGGIGDVHAFWERTGNFYQSGQGSDNLVDPFIGLSVFPAVTGVYRDMTQVRFDVPKWLPEKCTACGDCYTVCPDSAIPGLVNSVSEIFQTTIGRIEKRGLPTRFLRRSVRDIEKRIRSLLEVHGDGADMQSLFDQAVLETLAASELVDNDKATLEKEMGLLMAEMGSFKFAATRPYYSNNEKRAKGSGGLFSITINPYTCKGCMECIEVCSDQALVPITQNAEIIQNLRTEWAFWLDLPTTSPDYIRIDDLDEKIGALETLMLDKTNYNSMVCGDGACLGCGEKTAVHLFTSTVSALMQPRVKKHLAHVETLITRLEGHIRLKLAENMSLDDLTGIGNVVELHKGSDLTLSALSAELNPNASPIDSEWLKWVTQLLEKLRYLQSKYTGEQPRADMGIINSTGCTSVWGSTFPYNPYPFPWTSHLFQDSPSMAMGIFEGHMAKMSEGFKAVRMAELELAGKYNPAEHDAFFTYFDWNKFSDEEFLLCPPVVAMGGDGAMYDIGFQNLSRMMMSGVPIKVMVVDTQVYSNTGGQACTSGFVGQVSDMAPHGKVWKGKKEIRKEMSIIGMAHRTSYILQGSISHVSHLLEGYIEGLNSRNPAIFNIYAVCPPEHGVGDDVASKQSKLAVESRAYPLFKYDPDVGITFEECTSLEANPALDQDWPTYTITYQDENGNEATLETAMTFADFAVTEGRFRKHFRKAPAETWNDDMVQLHEFIDMDTDDRDGLFPYIWGVDAKNRLMRIIVSSELVTSTIERRDFWRQLKSLAGVDRVDNSAELIETTRREMAQKLSSSLLSLATDTAPQELAQALTGGMATSPSAANNGAVVASLGNGSFEPVWIESPECTACDECVEINPKLFAYNDQKLAVVVDPRAGSFKDIVRAAEKCTAGVIHPGTPADPQEKDLDKLIKRAAKFQ